MAYSDVSWAYKDPITVQKMTQMADNTIWTSEHYIQGCELSVTGTATVDIAGGRLEIDGNWLLRDTNDGTTGLSLTATDNNDWEEGATQEANATCMYVVAYNDSGNSFTCRFRLSAPAYSNTSSKTGTGPKRYPPAHRSCSLADCDRFPDDGEDFPSPQHPPGNA